MTQREKNADRSTAHGLPGRGRSRTADAAVKRKTRGGNTHAISNEIILHGGGGGAIAATGFTGAASAQVDWQKYKGQEINVLLNNHPWTQALRDLAKEFTAKTGVKVQMDVFGEEQFRARLTTVMQAKTGDLDGYMSLTIREGFVFDKAGWYQDLKPFIDNKSLTEAQLELRGLRRRLALGPYDQRQGRHDPHQLRRPVVLLAQGHLREVQDRRAEVPRGHPRGRQGAEGL